MFPLALQIPFLPAPGELRPFTAEIWLTIAIVAVLITPFFTRRANIPCALVSLGGLLMALTTLVSIAAIGADTGNYFRGMIVVDPLSLFFKIILLLFAIGIVLMWLGATGREMREGDGPEFFVLLLGATLGLSLMSCTANLLMIILAVELASLPSYILAGFRKSTRRGAEASLKYVLFGATASAIMIYGLSILYGLLGTLDLSTLSLGLPQSATNSPALLAVALAALFIGIGFKIAAVPLHWWCPDVFEGAGVDVAAFLSVASKGAALILLLRLLALLAAGSTAHTHLLSIVAIVIGIVGALSATLGNTAAFVQTNIKRLLAYSSIAHAGYMLCALSIIYGGHISVARATPLAAQALLLYLAIYMLMNLGAFTVAAVVIGQNNRASTPLNPSEQTDEDQIAGESLSAFAGLGRRAPLLAAAMTACLLSLVGLPPFAGFVAKLNILYILGSAGGWYWALLAIVALNTAISLYYYLRIIRIMYLSAPQDRPALRPAPLALFVSGTCAIALVILVIAFSPLLKITASFSQIDLNKPPQLVEQKPQ